jgi:hypothetical protein
LLHRTGEIASIASQAVFRLSAIRKSVSFSRKRCLRGKQVSSSTMRNSEETL